MDICESPKSKRCIITNGRFSYTLCVDGQSVEFQSNAAAEYFKKHYEELGYTVTYIENDEI